MLATSESEPQSVTDVFLHSHDMPHDDPAGRSPNSPCASTNCSCFRDNVALRTMRFTPGTMATPSPSVRLEDLERLTRAFAGAHPLRRTRSEPAGRPSGDLSPTGGPGPRSHDGIQSIRSPRDTGALPPVALSPHIPPMQQHALPADDRSGCLADPAAPNGAIRWQPRSPDTTSRPSSPSPPSPRCSPPPSPSTHAAVYTRKHIPPAATRSPCRSPRASTSSASSTQQPPTPSRRAQRRLRLGR